MTSLPGKYDIELFRGDTFDLPLVNNVATAWDSQGNATAWTPVDMTGGSLLAQVRDSTDYSATVLVTFTINSFVPASGSFTLHLAPSDTATAGWQTGFWDLQYTAASGAVQTLMYGEVTMIDDASHS